MCNMFLFFESRANFEIGGSRIRYARTRVIAFVSLTDRRERIQRVKKSHFTPKMYLLLCVCRPPVQF